MSRTLKLGLLISLGLHALAGAVVTVWWQTSASVGGEARAIRVTVVAEELVSATVPEPAPVQPPAPSLVPPVVKSEPEPETYSVELPRPRPPPVETNSPVATAMALAAIPVPSPPSSPPPAAVSASALPKVLPPRTIEATPVYRKNPEPDYPAIARRRRQEGVVLLSVNVSAQGQPTRLRVKESSGFPALDEAAVSAVRSWEFEPARVGLLPVDSEVEVPVRFQLAK